ncbi:MAG: DUF4412 domain-containing protein [Armatimonadota bacterium]|nr:DUF4412 domain-containing protein [Armatimonadota bacterium]
MKTVRLLVVLAGLLVLVLQTAEAATYAKSGYMEQTGTITNAGVSKSQNSKLYWKDKRWRMETLVGDRLMITIGTGDAIYTYSPLEKKAAKSKVNTPSIIEILVQQADRMKKVKGAKKTGTETIRGYKCEVYTLTSPDKKATGKAWMCVDPRLPIVLKQSVTAANGYSEVREIKTIRLNASVSDDKFTLPKGTKIIEVKAQPKAAPKSGSKK